MYRSIRRKTPYNTIYPFERNVSFSVRYNPSTGWDARGYGISFTWQLQDLLVEYGDLSGVSVPIAGATELSRLFDQWRIDKVDMQCFFTGTETLAGTGSNIPMPTMYICNDYDNSNVAAGTTNLAEYAQTRTVQFNPVMNGIRHTIYKPGVRSSVLIGTAGATSAANVVRSPWLDCGVADVNHFAIKCQALGVPFFDPNGFIGSMLFQFKIYYSMRNAK